MQETETARASREIEEISKAFLGDLMDRAIKPHLNDFTIKMEAHLIALAKEVISSGESTHSCLKEEIDALSTQFGHNQSRWNEEVRQILREIDLDVVQLDLEEASNRILEVETHFTKLPDRLAARLENTTVSPTELTESLTQFGMEWRGEANAALEKVLRSNDKGKREMIDGMTEMGRMFTQTIEKKTQQSNEHVHEILMAQLEEFKRFTAERKEALCEHIGQITRSLIVPAVKNSENSLLAHQQKAAQEVIEKFHSLENTLRTFLTLLKKNIDTMVGQHHEQITQFIVKTIGETRTVIVEETRRTKSELGQLMGNLENQSANRLHKQDRAMTERLEGIEIHGTERSSILTKLQERQTENEKQVKEMLLGNEDLRISMHRLSQLQQKMGLIGTWVLLTTCGLIVVLLSILVFKM